MPRKQSRTKTIDKTHRQDRVTRETQDKKLSDEKPISDAQREENRWAATFFRKPRQKLR
jgi:hypothetical protein